MEAFSNEYQGRPTPAMGKFSGKREWETLYHGWDLADAIKDLNFVQKLTFSPKAEDWSVFRMVFEAGVSWAFYKNMTFNFTLIDKYDSHPAKNIDKNDLQLVSSIGLKF